MRKSAVISIILLLSVVIMLLLTVNSLHYYFPHHPRGLTPQAVADLQQQNMLLLHYSYLPRIAVALLTGAMLGLAGWLCQLLLKNPLAEPSTLGIASGAQLGMTLATLLGSSVLISQGLSLAGALVCGVIIFILSNQRRLSPLTLLLTGLIIGLFCTALQNGIMLFRHQQLQNVFI